ncbi:MAG: SxtJ family membrane protein, partial [Gammaproteobacteria bacterium]|nr:SxtJ family membrane protein [Gammaproteobacteria bacterium]
LWPWAVGALLLLWSFVHPGSLRLIFRGWMALAAVLGWINTRIILGLVYYLIMLPTGFVMHMLRRDPMARRFNPDAATYRVPSKPPSRENMDKPF